MALSKKDQEFYEEKLNFKYIGYLFATTTVVGAVMCPLLAYLQDLSIGQGSTWTGDIVYKLAVMGFLLGSIVAVVMYLAFKCLLQIGWLPPRR